MPREGKKSKNRRNSNYKHPDPKSKRSERRANRGFKSLETSCRKHRRAAMRSAHKREISGVLYPPGTKADTSLKLGGKLKSSSHNAGGSLKYHCTS